MHRWLTWMPGDVLILHLPGTRGVIQYFSMVRNANYLPNEWPHQYGVLMKYERLYPYCRGKEKTNLNVDCTVSVWHLFKCSVNVVHCSQLLIVLLSEVTKCGMRSSVWITDDKWSDYQIKSLPKMFIKYDRIMVLFLDHLHEGYWVTYE